MGKKTNRLVTGDAHAIGGAIENKLEHAIGREVRSFRKTLGMTGTELARAADLSLGMLSKIENGQALSIMEEFNSRSLPSRATIRALFRPSFLSTGFRYPESIIFWIPRMV